jgi:hypothetical protein
MTRTLKKKLTIASRVMKMAVAFAIGLAALPGIAGTVYVDILNDSGTEDGTTKKRS